VTPQQADAYAEQVLTAIPDGNVCWPSGVYADDRERVHSALRALHSAEEGLEDALNCDCECYRQENHARRYAEARDDALDDLRRVGRLYGVGE
jgi:hypothetical protein